MAGFALLGCVDPLARPSESPALVAAPAPTPGESARPASEPSPRVVELAKPEPLPMPDDGSTVDIAEPEQPSGSGYVQRPPTMPTAEVEQDEASLQIEGALDRARTWQVIEAHVDEVRGCYEAKLRNDYNLSGRLTVQFIISRTGEVASVAIDPLDDAGVGLCVSMAVRRWVFDKLESGGVALVSYQVAYRPG